jgi:hypothetical protein
MTHAFGGSLQHEKDGAQIDGQHAVPFVLSEFEQWPDFGNPRVIEQHINASPTLEGEIEHALDVRCTSNVHLERGLTKLVSKGLHAITIHVRQQQSRAIVRHTSRASSADATGSAGNQGMNTVQPISHLKRVPREDNLLKQL